jgi:hypothetical protein
VEFWPDRSIVKDNNDDFKVVTYGYCDESERMYKLGKSSTPPASNKFIAMVADADDDSKLWYFRLDPHQL